MIFRLNAGNHSSATGDIHMSFKTSEIGERINEEYLRRALQFLFYKDSDAFIADIVIKEYIKDINDPKVILTLIISDCIFIPLNVETTWLLFRDF
jgi:hypothetical protein